MQLQVTLKEECKEHLKQWAQSYSENSRQKNCESLVEELLSACKDSYNDFFSAKLGSVN
jgi:hypothetical protein